MLGVPILRNHRIPLLSMSHSQRWVHQLIHREKVMAQKGASALPECTGQENHPSKSAHTVHQTDTCGYTHGGFYGYFLESA